MSESEFQDYAEYGIRSFAGASPRYRDTPREQALLLVREDFHGRILPQGLNTPAHYLWSIWNGRTHVGYLHLGELSRPTPGEIHAWDLVIFEPHRRKGFAKSAMLEAGKKLKELGYRRVGLNVFGENRVATQLYESLGFRVTQVYMSREIAGEFAKEIDGGECDRN